MGFVALGVLLAVGIVAWATGPQLARLYATTVENCASHGDCAAARTALLSDGGALQTLFGILVIVAPGLIGIFYGAPLIAGELETGTFRLAWTQSITRTRWLVVKLGVVGLGSMAGAGLLSLMVTWWSRPLDQTAMDQYATFDQRGVVPIGYAAFAFVLGVAIGIPTRRTLPSIALTLVAFLSVRLAFAQWARPNIIAPAIRNTELNPATTGYGPSGLPLIAPGTSTLQPNLPNIPNGWITSTQILDRTGNALTAKVLQSDCPTVGHHMPGVEGPSSGTQEAPASVRQALHDCVTKVGTTYHQVVTYQPANRYWTLQWYETAIFLGAALVLAAFCVWWIRRNTR
jgi:hypothetical protein